MKEFNAKQLERYISESMEKHDLMENAWSDIEATDQTISSRRNRSEELDRMIDDMYINDHNGEAAMGAYDEIESGYGPEFYANGEEFSNPRGASGLGSQLDKIDMMRNGISESKHRLNEANKNEGKIKLTESVLRNIIRKSLRKMLK